MVDGFHWTRVTSKQLRFLYEAVTLVPAPPHMYELAARIDHHNLDDPANPASRAAVSQNAAVRNSPSAHRVDGPKEHKP